MKKIIKAANWRVLVIAALVIATIMVATDTSYRTPAMTLVQIAEVFTLFFSTKALATRWNRRGHFKALNQLINMGGH